MAHWKIIDIGHDKQGFVQHDLYYDDVFIGTDTLGPIMDTIRGDGRNKDTVEERHSNGVVCHYTVADERESERKWRQYLAELDAAETNEAAGEGG